MNEKMQYATMLEIPVSTCNITYKPLKKKKPRKKNASSEAVKQELMDKVNASVVSESDVAPDDLPNKETKGRKRVRLSLIGAETFIVAALVMTIIFTNVFKADSAINTFFKSVFKSEEPAMTDVREYGEFTPALSGVFSSELGDDGVITLSGEGSAYSPCNGTVKTVSVDGGGKYILEIEHSSNFVSVLSGLDYAYATVGDKVLANVPVGYVKENAAMCFYSGDGAVITGYELVDGSVVWVV